MAHENNPDYYKQEIARRDEQTTSHLAWMAEQGNTITGLRNELKDRDERIDNLEQQIVLMRELDNMEQNLVRFMTMENKISTLVETVTRLKEDAERISKYCTHIPPPLDTGWKTPCTYGNCVCGRDNAITLHRALMKELE